MRVAVKLSSSKLKRPADTISDEHNRQQKTSELRTTHEQLRDVMFGLWPAFIAAWLKAGIRCTGLRNLELSLSGYQQVEQESFHALINALPKLTTMMTIRYKLGFHSKRLRDWAFRTRFELKMQDWTDPWSREGDYDSDGEAIEGDDEGDEGDESDE